MAGHAWLIPACGDYDADGNEFRGVINWVQIETGKADNRHLISPEDRWRVAMARQ